MNIFSYTNKGGCMERRISEDDIFEISSNFKALGDGNRFKIVLCLLNEEKNVSQISGALNLSQSATSHQLRILRDARILKSKKVKNEIFYRISDNHIKSIIEMTLEHLSCRDGD